MPMTKVEQAALLACVAIEMKTAVDSGETIAIEFTLPQAMGLLGTLQLAMRHPKFNGPTSETMRNLANVLEAGLHNCGPATARLCELGWNPEEDTE